MPPSRGKVGCDDLRVLTDAKMLYRKTEYLGLFIVHSTVTVQH